MSTNALSKTLQPDKVRIDPKELGNLVCIKSYEVERPRIIKSLDISPDGNYILSANDHESVTVYNLNAVKESEEYVNLHSKKYGVDIIRFAEDKNFAVHNSTKVDDALRYLDLHKNSYIRYYKGHSKRVTSLAKNALYQGFLTSSLDQTVRLWDYRSPKAWGVLRTKANSIATFDSVGNIIATAINRDAIKLYDVRKIEDGPFLSFKHERDNRADWTNIQVSPNGKFILINTNGSYMRVIDSYNGKVKGILEGHKNDRHYKLTGCFSPDSKFVWCGSSDSTLHCWNSESGAHVSQVETNHVSAIGVTIFHKKAHMLASACRRLSLWLPVNIIEKKVRNDLQAKVVAKAKLNENTERKEMSKVASETNNKRTSKKLNVSESDNKQACNKCTDKASTNSIARKKKKAVRLFLISKYKRVRFKSPTSGLVRYSRRGKNNPKEKKHKKEDVVRLTSKEKTGKYTVSKSKKPSVYIGSNHVKKLMVHRWRNGACYNNNLKLERLRRKSFCIKHHKRLLTPWSLCHIMKTSRRLGLAVNKLRNQRIILRRYKKQKKMSSCCFKIEKGAMQVIKKYKSTAYSPCVSNAKQPPTISTSTNKESLPISQASDLKLLSKRCDEKANDDSVFKIPELPARFKQSPKDKEIRSVSAQLTETTKHPISLRSTSADLNITYSKTCPTQTPRENISAVRIFKCTKCQCSFYSNAESKKTSTKQRENRKAAFDNLRGRHLNDPCKNIGYQNQSSTSKSTISHVGNEKCNRGTLPHSTASTSKLLCLDEESQKTLKRAKSSKEQFWKNSESSRTANKQILFNEARIREKFQTAPPTCKIRKSSGQPNLKSFRAFKNTPISQKKISSCFALTPVGRESYLFNNIEFLQAFYQNPRKSRSRRRSQNDSRTIIANLPEPYCRSASVPIKVKSLSSGRSASFPRLSFQRVEEYRSFSTIASHFNWKVKKQFLRGTLGSQRERLKQIRCISNIKSFTTNAKMGNCGKKADLNPDSSIKTLASRTFSKHRTEEAVSILKKNSDAKAMKCRINHGIIQLAGGIPIKKWFERKRRQMNYRPIDERKRLELQGHRVIKLLPAIENGDSAGHISWKYYLPFQVNIHNKQLSRKKIYICRVFKKDKVKDRRYRPKKQLIRIKIGINSKKLKYARGFCGEKSKKSIIFEEPEEKKISAPKCFKIERTVPAVEWLVLRYKYMRKQFPNTEVSLMSEGKENKESMRKLVIKMKMSREEFKKILEAWKDMQSSVELTPENHLIFHQRLTTDQQADLQERQIIEKRRDSFTSKICSLAQKLSEYPINRTIAVQKYEKYSELGEKYRKQKKSKMNTSNRSSTETLRKLHRSHRKRSSNEISKVKHKERIRKRTVKSEKRQMKITNITDKIKKEKNFKKMLNPDNVDYECTKGKKKSVVKKTHINRHNKKEKRKRPRISRAVWMNRQLNYEQPAILSIAKRITSIWKSELSDNEKASLICHIKRKLYDVNWVRLETERINKLNEKSLSNDKQSGGASKGSHEKIQEPADEVMIAAILFAKKIRMIALHLYIAENVYNYPRRYLPSRTFRLKRRILHRKYLSSIVRKYEGRLLTTDELMDMRRLQRKAIKLIHKHEKKVRSRFFRNRSRIFCGETLENIRKKRENSGPKIISAPITTDEWMDKVLEREENLKKERELSSAQDICRLFSLRIKKHEMNSRKTTDSWFNHKTRREAYLKYNKHKQILNKQRSTIPQPASLFDSLYKKAQEKEKIVKRLTVSQYLEQRRKELQSNRPNTTSNSLFSSALASLSSPGSTIEKRRITIKPIKRITLDDFVEKLKYRETERIEKLNAMFLRKKEKLRTSSTKEKDTRKQKEPVREKHSRRSYFSECVNLEKSTSRNDQSRGSGSFRSGTERPTFKFGTAHRTLSLSSLGSDSNSASFISQDVRSRSQPAKRKLTDNQSGCSIKRRILSLHESSPDCLKSSAGKYYEETSKSTTKGTPSSDYRRSRPSFQVSNNDPEHSKLLIRSEKSDRNTKSARKLQPILKTKDNYLKMICRKGHSISKLPKKSRKSFGSNYSKRVMFNMNTAKLSKRYPPSRVNPMELKTILRKKPCDVSTVKVSRKINSMQFINNIAVRSRLKAILNAEVLTKKKLELKRERTIRQANDPSRDKTEKSKTVANDNAGKVAEMISLATDDISLHKGSSGPIGMFDSTSASIQDFSLPNISTDTAVPSPSPNPNKRHLVRDKTGKNIKKVGIEHQSDETLVQSANESASSKLTKTRRKTKKVIEGKQSLPRLRKYDLKIDSEALLNYSLIILPKIKTKRRRLTTDEYVGLQEKELAKRTVVRTAECLKEKAILKQKIKEESSTSTKDSIQIPVSTTPEKSEPKLQLARQLSEREKNKTILGQNPVASKEKDVLKRGCTETQNTSSDSGAFKIPMPPPLRVKNEAEKILSRSVSMPSVNEDVSVKNASKTMGRSLSTDSPKFKSPFTIPMDSLSQKPKDPRIGRKKSFVKREKNSNFSSLRKAYPLWPRPRQPKVLPKRCLTTDEYTKLQDYEIKLRHKKMKRAAKIKKETTSKKPRSLKGSRKRKSKRFSKKGAKKQRLSRKKAKTISVSTSEIQSKKIDQKQSPLERNDEKPKEIKRLSVDEYKERLKKRLSESIPAAPSRSWMPTISEPKPTSSSFVPSLNPAKPKHDAHKTDYVQLKTSSPMSSQASRILYSQDSPSANICASKSVEQPLTSSTVGEISEKNNSALHHQHVGLSEIKKDDTPKNIKWVLTPIDIPKRKDSHRNRNVLGQSLDTCNASDNLNSLDRQTLHLQKRRSLFKVQETNSPHSISKPEETKLSGDTHTLSKLHPSGSSLETHGQSPISQQSSYSSPSSYKGGIIVNDGQKPTTSYSSSLKPHRKVNEQSINSQPLTTSPSTSSSASASASSLFRQHRLIVNDGQKPTTSSALASQPHHSFTDSCFSKSGDNDCLVKSTAIISQKSPMIVNEGQRKMSSSVSSTYISPKMDSCCKQKDTQMISQKERNRSKDKLKLDEDRPKGKSTDLQSQNNLFDLPKKYTDQNSIKTKSSAIQPFDKRKSLEKIGFEPIVQKDFELKKDERSNTEKVWKKTEKQERLDQADKRERDKLERNRKEKYNRKEIHGSAEKLDKSEKDKKEKSEKLEKKDKMDKSESVGKLEHTEKIEKFIKKDKVDKLSKSEKLERNTCEKPDKHKYAKTEISERHEKKEKEAMDSPEKTDKTEKSKAKKLEKMERLEKQEKQKRVERRDISTGKEKTSRTEGKLEKPEKMDKLERKEKLNEKDTASRKDRNDKLEKQEKTDRLEKRDKRDKLERSERLEKKDHKDVSTFSTHKLASKDEKMEKKKDKKTHVDETEKRKKPYSEDLEKSKKSSFTPLKSDKPDKKKIEKPSSAITMTPTSKTIPRKIDKSSERKKEMDPLERMRSIFGEPSRLPSEIRKAEKARNEREKVRESLFNQYMTKKKEQDRKDARPDQHRSVEKPHKANTDKEEHVSRKPSDDRHRSRDRSTSKKRHDSQGKNDHIGSSKKK